MNEFNEVWFNEKYLVSFCIFEAFFSFHYLSTVCAQENMSMVKTLTRLSLNANDELMFAFEQSTEGEKIDENRWPIYLAINNYFIVCFTEKKFMFNGTYHVRSFINKKFQLNMI